MPRINDLAVLVEDDDRASPKAQLPFDCRAIGLGDRERVRLVATEIRQVSVGELSWARSTGVAAARTQLVELADCDVPLT